MRDVLYLTASVSFLLTWLYLLFAGDEVGAVTGSLFSLFGFPLILWAVVLAVSIAFAIRTKITMSLGDWVWLLVSVAGAYLPVFVVWIALSVGH